MRAMRARRSARRRWWKRACPFGGRAPEGFVRQMIHLGRRANALGDIAPGVVHLQEVATAAARSRRETAVPRVGDEERDIAGLDLEQNRGSTVVREIFV